MTEIRSRHAVAAFHEVSGYLKDHPNAPDAAAGYRFLFDTAAEFDLAREAKPLAARFLNDYPDAPLADRSRARRVAMKTLALEGHVEAAIDLFGDEIAVYRRLDPTPALDTATMLAAAVQRGGHPETATAVYERLKRSFFLNEQVTAFADNRLAKLERLGKPAPMIGMSDFDGNPVDLADFNGQIVLIDFWATNCPPCLEELPQLRQLAADHKKGGFSILAVSLDEEESTVQRFLDRTPVPWRVFLSSSDGDATRDAYGVETIPSNFLIAPDGTVAAVDLHGDDLKAKIEQLLDTE